MLDTYSRVLPTIQERATEKLERMFYSIFYSIKEDGEEKLKTGRKMA